MSIRCPSCGVATLQYVRDSRPSGEAIRRRRECADCGERFTTMELNVERVTELMQAAASPTPDVLTVIRGLRDVLNELPLDEPPASQCLSLRQPSERNIEIMRRYDNGEGTLNALGEQYGISGSRVGQIVARTREQLAQAAAV